MQDVIIVPNDVAAELAGVTDGVLDFAARPAWLLDLAPGQQADAGR